MKGRIAGVVAGGMHMGVARRTIGDRAPAFEIGIRIAPEIGAGIDAGMPGIDPERIAAGQRGGMRSGGRGR